MNTTANYYEQLEKLQQEKSTMLAEFRACYDKDRIEELLILIRNNEGVTKTIKAAKKVQEVNKEQQRKREAAIIAWEAEQPIVDVTNNDGSFHSVKVKKYPNLAKCDRATFKDGVYYKLRVGQYDFYMFRTKHEYNKPTVYTRPATFIDFLELNSVMFEDMTLSQYDDLSNEMLKAKEALEEAKKVYEQKMNYLNSSFLAYVGLASQDREGIYTMNF